MVKDINRIVKQNIIKLENDDNILSIFLVGSMASEDYKEKELNDYDIRFIVKRMNVSTYNKINKVLENIRLDIQRLDISCQISDVIGPVKMEAKSNRNVLIHSIVMTQLELDNLPKIHKYSYSMKYNHLYGKNFVERYNKLVLVPNDIISVTEGIDFCIKMLKTGENSYARWIINNDKMHLNREYVVASKTDMIELFYYSYNKAFNNIKNMIKSNGFNVQIEDYLDFSQNEKILVNKIVNNEINEIDINDLNIKLICKILYKLEQVCLKIYKDNKKYYNSLEWGIIADETKEMRKKGFDYLKKIKLQTGNNFSISYYEYLTKKDDINNKIKGSNYLVIFEPPSSNYARYGLKGITSCDEIDEYVKNNEIDLNKYNVSFIEIIKEIPNSFAGALMCDGRGRTIIETVSDTCDSRELTSTGTNAKRINTYVYISYDDIDIRAPRVINEIKEMCQYFKGYYEFAYGEIRGIKDVYFTFYSSDSNYINVFEGGKKKCKIITK